MNPGKRSPAERVIIYTTILEGQSLPTVNERLGQIGGRSLPASSYESIRRSYVPYFRGDMTRLARAVVSPPTWTQIAGA